MKKQLRERMKMPEAMVAEDEMMADEGTAESEGLAAEEEGLGVDLAEVSDEDLLDEVKRRNLSLDEVPATEEEVALI